MLLRLRRGTPGPQIDSILALAKDFGYRARFLDESSELLQLEGQGRPEHCSRFEDCAGVEAILDPGDAHERHERAPGQPDTVVHVGDAKFGGGYVSLIAGPCAVEDLGRLLEIARAVQAVGAVLLRGGAYKPRRRASSSSRRPAPKRGSASSPRSSIRATSRAWRKSRTCSRSERGA